MRWVTGNAARTAWVAVAVMLMCGAQTALAAKDVFIRSKPHVNVGTVGGVVMGVGLHANVHLDSASGEASGPLQAQLETGERVNAHALEGEVVDSDAGPIVVLLVRLGDGDDDDLDLVIVRRHPTMAECLIYDFVGPNVLVVAEGTIEFKAKRSK